MGIFSALSRKMKSSSSRGNVSATAQAARADALADPLGGGGLQDPLNAPQADGARADAAGGGRHSFNPFKKLFGKKDKTGKGKEHLKDRHVTGMRGLGGGSANDVSKVSYRREIGGSGQKEGFFKADFDRDRLAAESGRPAHEVNMAGTGYLVGLEEDDPRNAARSVASSRIDKLLGTNVVSQDTFAKHGGQVGVVSPEVSGRSLSENVYETEASGVSAEKARTKNNAAGGMYKIDGEQTYLRNGQSFGELDWADPEIQRGFANLQAMDYLSGQLDRHGGNIFVDPQTGKVTGIDNDIAFGSSYAADFEKRGLDKNLGMPSMIDGELAERMVMQDPGEYERTLRGKKGDYGHLNESEVEAAMTRFYRLQAYCEELLADPQNPDPRLVYNWDAAALEQTLALGAKGSILGAHKHIFDTSTRHELTHDNGSIRRMRRPGEKAA